MIARTTFQDTIDHLVDYIGGNPTQQALRDCRRAALAAYRDLCNAFNWSYFYDWGRIITNTSYDSTVAGATIQYQMSSGTYPRQLTISGATWPPWAANGVIRIGGIGGDVPSNPYDSVYHGPETASIVAYKVDQQISATVVTLDEVISPPFDVPAGTDFLLYQDTYLLPEDFVAQDQGLYELNFGGLTFTHPRDWLFENRYIFATGVPQYFTITGDQKYPGRLVSRFFPWPFEQKSIDFIYKRRPRALLNPLYSAGTVSVTQGQTTVNGTGTVFSPSMVGSVLRISGTSTAPTSLIMGTNTAVFESIIMSWVSPTQVAILDPLDATWTNVGYTISDAIDIEEGAMLNAYLRCCEKHIGMQRTLKDKPSAAKQFDIALAAAKAADSRSFANRSAGGNGRIRPRLRDMPIDLSNMY